MGIIACWLDFDALVDIAAVINALIETLTLESLIYMRGPFKSPSVNLIARIPITALQTPLIIAQIAHCGHDVHVWIRMFFAVWIMDHPVCNHTSISKTSLDVVAGEFDLLFTRQLNGQGDCELARQLGACVAAIVLGFMALNAVPQP